MGGEDSSASISNFQQVSETCSSLLQAETLLEDPFRYNSHLSPFLRRERALFWTSQL